MSTVEANARLSWAEERPSWSITLSATESCTLGLGVALSALRIMGGARLERMRDCRQHISTILSWLLHTDLRNPKLDEQENTIMMPQ